MMSTVFGQIRPEFGSSFGRAAVGSFGERLQRERANRKVSLEEIATATKIGTRNLRALETEDFDDLPGGIFNRGFVRSYARYLGLDEEQTVAEYLAADGSRHDGSLPFTSADIERSPINVAAWTRVALFVIVLAGAAYAAVAYSDEITGLWKRLLALRHITVKVSEAVDPAPAPARAVPPPPPEFAAVSDTAATITPVSMTLTQSPTDPRPTQSPAQERSMEPDPKLALPRSEERLPTPARTGMSANPTTSEQFTVHVRARQDAWLSINADGRKLMEGTLSAAGERSFRAAHNLVFVTGNAGGVEISFNGKLLPTVGGERQPKKLLFTEEGLQR